MIFSILLFLAWSFLAAVRLAELSLFCSMTKSDKFADVPPMSNQQQTSHWFQRPQDLRLHRGNCKIQIDISLKSLHTSFLYVDCFTVCLLWGGNRRIYPDKMRLTLQMLISHGRVARKMGLGPQSRINMLRNILTGLVRHERIETTLARADEVRFYAEKVTTTCC